MAPREIEGEADSDFRIGVDIGGTFTDLVLASADGSVTVFKVPSNAADPASGVLDAVETAARANGLSAGALLRRCSLFVHGSTIATNTLLERKGAKLGALVTAGFRDSLEIRRGLRPNPWDHRTPYPPVLVPRYLRRSVAGRIDKHGAEETPLATAEIEAAAAELNRAGVEAVAICLFNSFLSDAHERRCAEILTNLRPGWWLSLSSHVAPIMGEYERSSTAVLNAYVGPRAVSYLAALDARLRELGLPGRLLLIQNNGGAVSVDEIAARPVALLLSGPAAGVGALRYYSQAIGADDLISMEIGGTSCDVILMSGGRVAQADRLDIEGYDAVTPSIDVHTIGAGGGTIAGVDGAGLLFVGPEGAGAHPGPACYGKGGTRPTVTDAQVVLGRLNPDTYAGGVIAIDATLARQAIESVVGTPLGLDAESAAAGMLRLMEQKLLHAVQRISIERGHDPRRFTLVAGGGAGALHAVTVARALGCRRVYVPRVAGAFCALGMLNSDVRHDFLRVHFDRLERHDTVAVARIFGQLEEEARATLQREGFAASGIALQRAVDLRYRGQQWDITVTLADAAFDPAAIRRDFEAEHQRLFGHTQPEGTVEVTKLRVAGIGSLPRLALVRPTPADGALPAAERRRVWIDAKRGWQEVAVYRGSDLAPGHRTPGPAIVDEQTTTLLVGACDALAVDAAGNFVIEIGEEA
jgi:N-methylhydantoinase A